MKSKTQFIMAALIAAKIAICLIFIFQVETGSLFWGTDAIAAESDKSAAKKPVVASNTYNDGKVDINFIVQKMDSLKKKEQELEQKRAEILIFQEEIDKKIAKLTKLRNEIKSQMTRKKTIEKKKIKHLIKAYSAMKAPIAAGLIEKQDRKFAIELLSQMKGETVGKILSFVEQDKAAKLIEGLAKRK